jgi:hypothetical protein
MADYLYSVRCYVDVALTPRGTGGTLLQQANSNIGGFTPADTAGNAPFAQTMRFLSDAPVGNVSTVAPTAAQIAAAINVAAANIQTKLTAPVLTSIGNWALGLEF